MTQVVKEAGFLPKMLASVAMVVTAALLVTVRVELTPETAEGPTADAVSYAPSMPSGAPSRSAQNAPLSRHTLTLPLFFEANVGQSDFRVRYFSRGNGYTLFLTPREAVLRMHRSQRVVHGSGRLPEASPATVVRLKYDSINPASSFSGSGQTGARINYLIGRDPRRWHRGVPTYRSVTERGLWPGIDLVYHGGQNQMEMDLMVAPGANPRAISLSVEGADEAEIDSSGTLDLVAAGQHLRLLKPGVYQDSNGVRKAIAGRYIIRRATATGANRVYRIGFRLASYDKRLPLVIDPVITYQYVSYLGGSLVDIGDAVAVDPKSGNLYVSGQSDSPDFPVSGSAYQKICKGCSLSGAPSAFVAEIDPNVPSGDGAASLIYATFLGGSGNAKGIGDEAYAVTIDSNGNTYLGGYTYSSDFPLVNPFQSNCKACPIAEGDAFVSELNYDGSELLYSTYLGGSGEPSELLSDEVSGIAVDSGGNIHVAGSTFSNDFPTTSHGLIDIAVVYGEGFYSVLNPALSGSSELVYSTYLAGTGSGGGAGGIALDTSGNAYVSGFIGSGFPTIADAYEGGCSSGGKPSGGTIVAKFEAATHLLAYSTYLCSSILDPNGYPTIAVDDAGNIYLTGTANSTLSTTPNAPQPVEPSGPKIDASAFAVKLNPSLPKSAQLLFSTFIGGSGGATFGRAIAYANGQIYVTGGTVSANLLLSHNATEKTYHQTFITVLNPAASTPLGALVFSSYFGGNGSETGAGVGVDAAGNFTVVGASSSSNLPTTPNAVKASCPTCAGSDSRIAGFNAWIASYKVGAPTLVEGHIYDVALNFPNRTSVDLNLPLAEAAVTLRDGTGAIVAGDTTDTTGYYELDAIEPPGTYTVEVTKDAYLYSSSSNSYSLAPVKQVRTVTVTGTAPATLSLNLPVSIVSETATREFALNNLPAFAGVIANPEHYNTVVIEAYLSNIVRKSPPPDFIGVFNGAYPRDDWNSIIRIDVAMETLGERASDAVLLANDMSKALGQWVVLRVFKELGKAVFATTPKPLNKSVLTAAGNALKASLDFAVYFVIKPLATAFNVSAVNQAKITEVYVKLFKLGIDTFLGSLTAEATYLAIYQAIRFELFQLIVLDFVNNTQPSLDTAAVQFGHDAISADTNSTLETVSLYDEQLSTFAKFMDGITMSALADISVVTGTVATSGAFGELQNVLFSGGSLPVAKFASVLEAVLDFLKKPADRAVDAAYATGCIAPLIGETLSIDPANAAITAAMTGAGALPPPPSAVKVRTNSAAVVQGAMATITLTTTTTPLPTASPVPTSTPTATAVPLPAAVQEYLDELGTISKILAANDVAAYNAETTSLLAANQVLFNYLTPIGQRASGAMPQLSGPATTDAISLASEYDAASNDAGLSYLALQLWAVAQDSNSLATAASFVADTVAAVTSAGQQAVLVQSDLKGVTVPSQIVIAGDGVPYGEASFGSTVTVDYSLTNVGDKALPAGSVTLLPNANLALLTEATVSLPSLAPGGVFLAGWQFKVSGSTSPIDFGHYQIDSTVTGAQPASLDEIFVIAGVPTPATTPSPTPERTTTPAPTPSRAATASPTRSPTPKPTPSATASATPTTPATPLPLGDTSADRVLGQHYLTTYYANLVDAHSMNHPQRVAIDRSVTPNHIYVSDTYYNRVLGWRDATNYKNGDPADLIIGQADEFSIGVLAINIINCPNVTASSLCQPEGLTVDSAGNLYVADTGDDRVLKYNTPFRKTGVAGSGDPIADMIFGLSSFTVSPGVDTILCNGGSILTPPTAATLCEPSDVVVDAKGDVFVSDSGNCRVLEYNSPGVNDPSANLVFGQVGFTTKTCNNGDKTVSQKALGDPTALVLDTTENLYVTDALNNRVLEYFKPLVPVGAGGVGDTTPDLVLGQSSFTGSNCGSGVDGLCFNSNPSYLPPNVPPGSGGLGLDGSGNLYIADTANNRVVEYDAPLSSKSAADLVFGGTCDPAPPTTVFPPYPQVGASTLCGPGGVAVDGQNDLFVADTSEGLESGGPLQGNQGRVLEYIEPKAPPKPATGAGDAIPDRVLGQIDFTKEGPNMVKSTGFALGQNPGDVAVDTSVFPNRVYVTDTNNRVLAWHDVQGFKNGDPADLVFGQPDFYSYLCNNGGVSANSLCQPAGVAVDSVGNLYVADFLNHRVLEYNTPFSKTAVPGSGDTTADTVFGQSGSFTSDNCGGGSGGLCHPTGVGVDPSNNVFIADRDNNRVLVFNTPLKVTGVAGSGDTSADLVFGQPDPFSNSCNQNSVAGVAPSADTLCQPVTVISDGAANIYIADRGNGRVLEYDHPLSGGTTTARRVFGHNGNFTEGVNGYACNNGLAIGINASANTLCYPVGLGVDHSGDLFVADWGNNRVVEYNYPLAKTGEPGSGDTTADRVYGQDNIFTGTNCNGPSFTLGADTLCNPVGVSVASDDTVLIVDGDNNRVLAYDPLAAPTATPTSSVTPSPVATAIPSRTATATRLASPTPTGALASTPTPMKTPTPSGSHSVTPTPTPPICMASTPKLTAPVPTPTPLPGHPRIRSVQSPVLAGASFIINGSGFTKGSEVNFFVSTSTGAVNKGPLKPDAATLSATELTVPVPATITLGQGFVSVVVINTDEDFVGSNPGFALLQGSAAAGLPSITGLNGRPLAATSLDSDFAVANVETTLLQGSPVVVNDEGNGFDTIHGVAVDVFCACPKTGGKVTQFLTPGNAGLKPDSITFTLPETAITGPGSFIVSNFAGGTYSAKSNAVSVPLGARISVTGVTQSGDTLTVNGTGFSTLTVINLFNAQAGKTVNLGGLNSHGAAKIPLALISSTKFTFTVPAGAVPGLAFVQALNPPFLPFTSSGNDPCGAFTLK